MSWLCGGFVWFWGDRVAGPGAWWLRARGSRSSTVACEAGQLDTTARARLGDTGWGHWLGDTGLAPGQEELLALTRAEALPVHPEL